jgi:hypothetical protein
LASIRNVQATGEALEPSTQNIQHFKIKKSITFFLCLWVIFPFLIRIRIHHHSWTPIESGSNPDPDPQLVTAARIFNTEEPAAILHHILSSGKYFLAFYAPSKAAEAVRRQAAAAAAAGEEGGGGPPAPSPHFVDVFERGSRSRQSSREAF